MEAPAEHHDTEPEQRDHEPKLTNRQDRKTVGEGVASYVGEQLGFQVSSKIDRRKKERKEPAGRKQRKDIYSDTLHALRHAAERSAAAARPR